MSVTITDKDYGFQRINLNFKELRHRSVKVGIMGSEDIEGVSVVDYAFYNEFGTSTIPSRPFMATTADRHGDTMTRFTEFLVRRIVNGKITPDTALANIGAKYQSLVQATVRDAKTWAVPNAASTVNQKGSTSPLIDTGRMVQSVRYEVE